jgi:hypothetical protein
MDAEQCVELSVARKRILPQARTRLRKMCGAMQQDNCRLLPIRRT